MKKNLETPVTEIETTEKVSFLSKVWKAIKKNPFTAILVVLLIVISSWLSIKLLVERNQYEKAKTEMVNQYETQIDSIQLKNIEFASRVFSWSVRSELMRENAENLNQLFNVFVKDSNAQLVQLINLETNTIQISTDKQFEGNAYTVPSELNMEEQFNISVDDKVTIFTPIMGLNNKIGLLMVEFKK